jgi:DNA-binding response OmpR family regulator
MMTLPEQLNGPQIKDPCKAAPILLVDEDPTVTRNLPHLFETRGFPAHQVGSANEALLKLRSRAFRLVLLDLQLPDFDGMCLLYMIRRLYPELPVLVLTGEDSVEVIIRALHTGVRGYLTKPLPPEAVFHCATEILNEPVFSSPRRGKTRRLQRPKRRKVLYDEFDFLD